jgi:hypothetical protein
MHASPEDLARDAHYGLLRLLTQFAAAANEADSPQALQRSLRLIRTYGRWTAGHVVTFAEGSGARHTVHSFWDVQEHEHSAGFIDHCASYVYTPEKDRLRGRCLRERKPVWISDLNGVTPGPRTILLRGIGMHTAFAFPVMLDAEPVAMLEFFADVREPDALMLANVGYIGVQRAWRRPSTARKTQS